MAIERVKGNNYEAECDAGCECDPVKGDSFGEVKDAIDDAGWLTKKVCGIYMNYCPECREEYED